VQFTGDNTTAQSWIEKQKVSSRFGQLSCMAVTWLQIHSQLRVEDQVHKEGIKMGFVDGLSRFRETPDLDDRLRMDMRTDAALTELLLTCDPSQDANIIDHHVAFSRINDAMLMILHNRS